MRAVYKLATALLLFAGTAVHAAEHCVVLQYHHFSDDTPPVTSVSLEQFDAHIDYLKNNDFTVLPLREVVDALKHRRELPDRCVSLSVDDAYSSVYTNAFPRLRKLGWPMTVFVNTEAVDKGIAAYMSWEQMRELSSQGVDFENHGHGHIHMIRRQTGESDHGWKQRIKNDISTAQQRITAELGIAPVLFAHPYGEYNPEVIAIVNELGLTGFGQQSGPAWPGADFGALPRFPMAARYAGMQSFVTKVNTLPMPVAAAAPVNPLVPLGQRRPALRLELEPGRYRPADIRCYVGGSDAVEIAWPKPGKGTLVVTPAFDLSAGRHRTNCTMPSAQKGRYHWYSHNWFVRRDDGSWYAEY